MNITGHNSYSGCRFYDIKGIYLEKHKHIYFIEFIIVINNLIYLILEIKKKSILFELQLIEFPRSFSIDIMHLFFENVASHMFKLWSNQFFKDNSNILH